MAIKKVAVIGHFGFGETLLNGQTIKTKILTEQLEKTFGEDEVLKLDTKGGISALVRLPFDVFGTLKNSQNIIILPAENGLRVISPLLIVLNVLFKRKLHYAVVGGWLPDFIADKKWLIWCLKKFGGIYVETDIMKQKLENLGLCNITVMPNCKHLDILNENDLTITENAPYKLCTFSRVMKEKGMEEAVNAVKTINQKYGKTIYTLDIFGQVDTSQTEWFKNLESTFPEYINYGGMVDYDKSVETLKIYFALLFPTYYEGEGLAGTVIDSYSAGVPVIASDWRYNTEVVEDGVTGKIFETKNVDKLCEILDEIYTSPQEWNSMKPNCLKQAEKYLPENVTKVLISSLK